METGESGKLPERRTERRRIDDRYFSVELTVGIMGPAYRCRIRDLSSKGLCILVPANSVILEHLKVGAVITMTYHPETPFGPGERLETEIRHITADPECPFKGHVLIGLKILELELEALSAAERI
jgi:hypothetical protein